MAVICSKQLKVPILGKRASDFAVGESVFLMENGSPVEYLVVNQGIPSGSSLYDSSCDGTWLLRKDIYICMGFNNEDSDYANSKIHTYLNADFFSLFDSDVQSIIKQVKIPYYNNGSVISGNNGGSAKIFLLSGREVNLANSEYTTVPYDSACLDYFVDCTNSKRIAYYNGTACYWWSRTPNPKYDTSYCGVMGDGTTGSWMRGSTIGVRPALILPFGAMFDSKTLIFKGVKS